METIERTLLRQQLEASSVRLFVVFHRSTCVLLELANG